MGGLATILAVAVNLFH